MAGGVLATTVQDGATGYFTEGTLERWNNVGSKYLGQIGNWIQKANSALKKRDSYSKDVRNKIFTSTETYKGKNGHTYSRIKETRGVGFFGATGGHTTTNDTLIEQWDFVVGATSKGYRSKSNEVSNELTNRNLLTEGYLILTQVGEAIRGDGEVKYKVVASTSNGAGQWTKAIEWNLNIFQFLNNAVHSAGNERMYFDTGISSESRLREKMDKAGLEGTPWTAADLQAFNMFLHQAERFVSLKGKERLFPLAAQVRTINSGQMLEAFLQLHLKFKFRRKGDKQAWLDLRQEFQRLLAASTSKALEETLSSPAPFWQGGEGGMLANTQVKGNNASLTNMLSLVRQMTRLFAIFSQLPKKVGEKVKHETVINSLRLDDDEAINAIVEMFYRDKWKEVYTLEIAI